MAKKKKAMKKCPKCKKPKLLKDFDRNKTRRDGRHCYCKVCMSGVNKKYQEENPDKCRTINQEWKDKNPGKVKTSRKKWREENPDKVKASNRVSNKNFLANSTPEQLANKHLKYRYGITLDDYNRMLVVQKGNCALCGEDLGPTSKGRQRHIIDHDHSNGHKRKCSREDVRGIVHAQCNTLIGVFENNLNLFDKVKSYVENHRRNEER